MDLFNCLIRPILNLFCCSLKHPPQPVPQGPLVVSQLAQPTTTSKVPTTEEFIPRTLNQARRPIPQLIIPVASVPGSAQGDNPERLSPGTRSSRVNSVSSNRSRYIESSGSSKKSSAGTFLRAQLRSARIECPSHAHYFFIPICEQKRLITIENVENEIRDRRPATEIEAADVRFTAEKICETALKLFAVLAYMERGPAICSLLKDGVSDLDLPLKRMKVGKEMKLQRKSEDPIETFERWSEDDIEDFDRIQHWMLAPVFQDREHYELEGDTILPFIPFNGNAETKETKVGGYSEVYAARIHPSHHNFWDDSDPDNKDRLVAIKRLISSDEMEFQKEATILRALASKDKKDPHLITLFTTFIRKAKYHLVFPYADANLRTYWENRPSPNFDKQIVLWSLKQMTGIATALSKIHNFTVTHPLSVTGAGKLRVLPDAKLCVEKEEELYGRHGDIKPENILWFQKAPDTEDVNGILQIADFGLGRFHGRDSRSKVPPDDVKSSPTYEPPECKLHQPVSRAYDIWSLGCLYLEFITWLLKGDAEIDGFSSARGKTAASTGINNDNFFTIVNDGSEAEVREGVLSWVQQLHEHERCSQLIHDLLDLIMSSVLRTESAQRMRATKLSEALTGFLGKAGQDMEYLLKPVPHRQVRLGADLRHPKLMFPLKTKGKNVSFLNHSKSGSPESSRPKTPKEMVPPGSPGTMKIHHNTWPQDG